MMEQNRLSRSARTIILLVLMAMLAACEKPLLDDAAPTAVGDSPAEANVILRFTQFEQEAFTRAATDITSLCSRLNIAIFNSEGTKVKTVAQKEGDSDYGTVALSLAEGTYQLVVIAHNCEGSATMDSKDSKD